MISTKNSNDLTLEPLWWWDRPAMASWLLHSFIPLGCFCWSFLTFPFFWRKFDSFWSTARFRCAIFQAWLQDGEFVRVLDEADATWADVNAWGWWDMKLTISGSMWDVVLGDVGCIKQIVTCVGWMNHTIIYNSFSCITSCFMLVWYIQDFLAWIRCRWMQFARGALLVWLGAWGGNHAVRSHWEVVSCQPHVKPNLSKPRKTNANQCNVYITHVVVACEPYLHACLQITGWHILTLAGP